MQEKDTQKVVQMPAGTELRRKPPVPNVPKMRRSKAPVRPKTPIWEGRITPEANLTEEQKAPLSNRPKPVNEAQGNFPKPAASAPVGKPTAPMKRRNIEKGTNAVAMRRHVPSVLEHPPIKTKPTKAENVAPTPQERPAANTQAVSAAVVKMPIDKKPLILSAIALFLVLVLVAGIVLGVMYGSTTPWWKPSGPGFGSNEPPVLTDRPTTSESNFFAAVDPNDPDVKNSYSYDYAVSTVVGFDGDVLATLDKDEIVKPVEEIRNEGLTQSAGLSRYPTYGSTPSGVLGTGDAQVALRNKLIAESAYLASSNTSHNSGSSPHPYNKIDAEGKLWYVNGETATPSVDNDGAQRYLYAHTSSVGMYGGNVSADEARVVKKVSMRARGYNGYGVTGLYAPAGEVIKIEIDDKDMNATGGLTIHIGQALYNGQANNIWTAKNQMNRFPVILNTMVINKSTATKNEATGKWEGYVGSFLGGPLYIRNTSVKFTATITGCVEYSHFILGYTTPADFARTSKSTAPYFDLEVWDRGVLHSGPKSQAQRYSYDDLYNVAVLWDKVASVTTYNSNQGIVFIYDPFVAAGAAVAFPGRRSVNCPTDWMSGSLNYNGIVSSGSWGNFHEYHHNFQNYGLGSGADGEVTNNGLNLVSYALFTKITSKRGIGSFGAQGVGGGWNNYTCASWALQRVKEGAITSTNGLAVYATLLHNFGADAYTRARGSSGKNNYLNKWATVTHHDFTYYAGLIESYGGGTYTPSAAVKDANYPMFVPVSSVYQTGRSYTYDGEKKYFTTMQPYVIPAGDEFTIDLSPYSAPNGQYASGSVVLPDGFRYRIKSISKPYYGNIEVVDDYHFKYVPDPESKSMRSGQILVTLEIIKDDGAFEVEETDLILEFEQSYETNKMTLERTTYTFTEDGMYTDAVAAFNANFAGSINKVEYNHSNPTQNCNTDIWFYSDTAANRQKYPDAPESYFIHENQIEVIDGKLYFAEDGKYRVYMRGRTNCALYYSVDGKSYNLGATIKNGSGAAFYTTNSDTYLDVTFAEGRVAVDTYTGMPQTYTYTLERNDKGDIINWLYVKEILIDTAKNNIVSYIGLGMNQWTQTMFTMTETYHKADNTAVDSPAADGYAYTKVTYRDYNNNEVAYSRTESGTTTYFKKSGNAWVASTTKEVSELTESKLIPPTSAAYVNAYRSNYKFPDNSSFESEYFYVRNYNYNYTGNPVETYTWNEGVQILENNFVADPAGDYGIGNLLEEGTSLGHYIHSKSGNGVNKAPIYITLDMGKTIDANSITFYGRSDKAATTAQQGLPNQFKLEISMDGVNYEDAGTFNNGTGAATSATVNLGKTLTFRYVKITVNSSHSNNSHLILGGIRFAYTFTLMGNGANHFAPDSESLIFVDGEKYWEYVPMMASFGYTYRGKKGSKLKFEMKGTQFLILTSQLEGIDPKNFDVYIDGKRYDSMPTKTDDGDYAVNYISPKLENGNHKVEIRCKGVVYIDSLALFNN